MKLEPENSLSSPSNNVDENNCKVAEPKSTGRYIVVFREDGLTEGLQRLELLGLQTMMSADSITDEENQDKAVNERAVFFKTLGVAIVSASPDKIYRLIEATKELNSPIVTVEPEKIRRALDGRIAGSQESAFGDIQFSATRRQSSKKVAFDESQFTWGLQATGADHSKFSGRGIRVAILDTGLDFRLGAGGKVTYHPDFVGRTIVTSSFLPGAKRAKDGDGHGTHCTGTACGLLKPAIEPRYGIAYDADIFVAKVLNDEGDGKDEWIIAGIEWAINNRCRIISMALGWEKEPDKPYSVAYENIARRALKAGTLVMAAAGNDSLRPIRVCPLCEPAGCQSIMAVGAVNSRLEVATFSNGGIDPNSRGIDITGPGVDIQSSSLMPGRYSTKYGTSMAVSHVAGIGALYAEANPGVFGGDLWSLIVINALSLPFLPQDVGAGLVKAP
jgi:subtilisin family serine protease